MNDLSDAQLGAIRWALSNVERIAYQSGSVLDSHAKALRSLLAEARRPTEAPTLKNPMVQFPTEEDIREREEAQAKRPDADGWLQSGGLLYRLTDERRPQNRDEINVTMANGSRDDAPRAARASVILAMLTGARQPSGEVTDEPAPSLTNPLTPYGMLVRALRIVAQTSLYDMGQAMLLSPAKLSAMEFGREPVTPEIVREVGTYFESLGIHNMRPALQFAADGARADTPPFEDSDERDEFIRACHDFDDDGETCVDYGLLMKWAGAGLLDCDHFTITKKGRAVIDAASSQGDSHE
ncbi:hypothetical protein [Burkholderia ubonensis]|uniref:hypothetical protein n=1 Tax=Burkholderia ubonensis TaxID=101571 RepID=UPI000A6512AD|nr:hypothetical protein [Burkholderia ubonensis]